MVIDKNLGLHGTEDLVRVAGEYIDIVKFGWGTSRLFSEQILIEKIKMLRSADIHVCPGGTFLEIASDHGRSSEFLAYARKLGFSAIEVSNGINPSMTPADKLVLIRQSVAAGFHVLAEVGRKTPTEDRHLTVTDRVAEVRADLGAGASKVVMEAREGGTLGIFDDEEDRKSVV